jgi:hypothetical protein
MVTVFNNMHNGDWHIWGADCTLDFSQFNKYEAKCGGKTADFKITDESKIDAFYGKYISPLPAEISWLPEVKLKDVTLKELEKYK